MKVNSHPPIPQIVLECLIKYFHQLFCPLRVFTATTGQMTIDYHDGLVFNLEPQTDRTLIASHSS